MQKLEAILHPGRFQLFQRAQRFGHGQPELRAVPSRRFPSSRAAAGQLDPQPDGRPHADALGMLLDQVELGVFFDHGNDSPADLRGQHHHLDVFVVLEAVADDGRVVVGDGQHGQQLRLRSGFQAELVRAAVFENFLHHLPLLVDLDRIHAAVVALVVVLRDGVLKCLMHFTQAVLQNLAEADQDRQRDSAQLQIVHQLLQIERAAAGPYSGCTYRCPFAPTEKYPLPQLATSYSSAASAVVQRSAGSRTGAPLVSLTVAMKFQCPSI